MAIRTVITRGYGNGTFNGAIALVVTRGYLPSAVVTARDTHDGFTRRDRQVERLSARDVERLRELSRTQRRKFRRLEEKAQQREELQRELTALMRGEEFPPTMSEEPSSSQPGERPSAPLQPASAEATARQALRRQAVISQLNVVEREISALEGEIAEFAEMRADEEAAAVLLLLA